MKLTPILVACFCALPLQADPVTLSRSEVFELHSALNTLSPGLTPENTLSAADDINALDADARAFKQAATKLVQAQQAVNSAPTPEGITAFHKLDEDFSTKAEVKKTYELSPFTLTKEEIKAAQISAAQVATIKRLLKSDPKPVK